MGTLAWGIFSVASLLVVAVLNVWVEGRRQERRRGFDVLPLGRVVKGASESADKVKLGR